MSWRHCSSVWLQTFSPLGCRASKLLRYFAGRLPPPLPASRPACGWLVCAFTWVFCVVFLPRTHTVPNVLGPLTHIIHITVDSEKFVARISPLRLRRLWSSTSNTSQIQWEQHTGSIRRPAWFQGINQSCRILGRSAAAPPSSCWCFSLPQSETSIFPLFIQGFIWLYFCNNFIKTFTASFVWDLTHSRLKVCFLP